ncbi:MAG: hypothetical protein ACK4UJ_00015 [Leptonema sp. (in: bacteria)]
MNLYELHTHLYGCLVEEDLQWLGQRRTPRWEIYINSFKKIYGYEPKIEILYKNQIFSNSKLNQYQKRILRKFYRMDPTKFGFLQFQNCFDFIIALSNTDPEELQEITKRVLSRQEEIYAEYRMMFSPFIKETEFKEKVSGLVEAFDSLETKIYPKQAKFIISLNREYPLYEWQYEIIKSLQKKTKNLIGIDFAGKEEGFPPKEKRNFIKKVLKENQSSKPLLLTYHVGESFTDKTPASTIRWILELQEMGVHRIGHAVALAYTEEKVQNKTFREIFSERKDYLNFLYSLYEKGEKWIPIDFLKKEEKLQNSSYIDIVYEGLEKKLYLDFLEYSLHFLRSHGAVIESCPTSNQKICGFSPLKFFVDAGLKVCLGADDPSILGTTLKKEFDYAKKILGKELTETIKKNNQNYCGVELLKKLYS